MKWKQKARLGVALLIAVVSVLAGCGKASEQSNHTSPSPDVSANEPGSADLSKQIELSIAAWDIQTNFEKPNAKNDVIYDDIAKKFNITIKPVQITWNDWAEKVKVWAASKQLPDIFANSLATDNTALYESWAKQGVIKAIPDDLSAYPNLQKLLSLPSVQPLKVDGKFYMIPRGGGDDTPGTAYPLSEGLGGASRLYVAA